MTEKKGSILLRDYITYYCAKLLIFFLRLLPHKLALRIAKSSGWLSFYFLPIRKKIVLKNLHLAFGREKDETELKDLAHKCYQNFAMMFVEFIRLPGLKLDYVASLIDKVEGKEHFEEVGGKNGGYIVISGHLGNWELAGSYLSCFLVPLSVIARPMHNLLFDAEINKIREAKGMKVILTKGFLKEVIKDVKDKRVVTFLIDQDAKQAGVFVDFFGKPASTFTGPAVLAQRFNLPILPCFAVRTNFHRHKVIFKPPIYPHKFKDPNFSDEQIIRQIAQEYTRIVELVVRDYPEQYFWFHRRWKTKSG